MSSSLPQQAALSMDLNYSYTQTGTNIQLRTHTYTHRILHQRRSWPFAFSLCLQPFLPSSLSLFHFFSSVFLWFTSAQGRRGVDQHHLPLSPSLCVSLSLISFFNLSFTQMLTHGYLPRSAHPPAWVLSFFFFFITVSNNNT